MSFDVASDAYGRYMGRYSEPLAAKFVALVGVRPGQRVLDVGCGPGALTTVLVDRLGADAVSAVDPSTSFVEALHARLPTVRVQRAVAEQLPFENACFDAALAQLVVHFMRDPVAGLREMARVTRPGGVVAASVWHHTDGLGPSSVFWTAAADLDPTAPNESDVAGAREGHLAELAAAAGLHGLESGVLTVEVTFGGFDEWWEPFTLGVGRAGDYVAALDDAGRERLRQRCAELLPAIGPFELFGSAWTVIGHV